MVTWPTRKVGMFRPFAANSSCVADFAHLADAARRRLQLEREHGLDRVDDHERRLEPGDLVEDPLDAGLGEDVERRRARRRAARRAT